MTTAEADIVLTGVLWISGRLLAGKDKAKLVLHQKSH
jgi:hypothetical protein